MKIVRKPDTGVKRSTLKLGDVYDDQHGRVFMVSRKETECIVIEVDLETGLVHPRVGDLNVHKLNVTLVEDGAELQGPEPATKHSEEVRTLAQIHMIASDEEKSPLIKMKHIVDRLEIYYGRDTQ